MRSLLGFSAGERRGILYLFPLLVAVSLIVIFVNRPHSDAVLIYQADAVLDSIARTIDKGFAPAPEDDDATHESFEFDPNTVTYRELLRLGFNKSSAAGFIKYRASGKVFGVKEEFAACYGVSGQMYDRLEPYILIGEQWRAKSHSGSYRTQMGAAATSDSLFCFNPNTLDQAGYRKLGFTQSQARVLVEYRDMIGGFAGEADFAKCYMVSPERLTVLRPYMVFEASDMSQSPVLIEINSADSTTLRSIRGIGEVTVVAIMEYRRRLGGFVSVAQLAEIYSVRERNFEQICKQIWVDSCRIQKIDVNFASPKQLNEVLADHPYGGSVVLRKLLKQRQLKGGWSSIGDMIEQKIVTPRQAEKLASYLLFNTMQHEN